MKPTRSIVICSAAVVVVAMLTSCIEVNEPKVIGTWTAETRCVDVRLEVLPDHTFVQSVRTIDGATNHVNGTWSLNRYGMNFKPFLDLADDTTGKQVVGMGSPVEWIGVLHMGPMMVKCADSRSEVDYTK
jgi:hypothetical protein